MGTILDAKGLRGLTPEALLAMNWWAAAIRGMSAIVLGLLAVMQPALTSMGLVIIFAVYCLVDEIFAVVPAIGGARKPQRWGWLTLDGVVSQSSVRRPCSTPSSRSWCSSPCSRPGRCSRAR